MTEHATHHLPLRFAQSLPALASALLALGLFAVTLGGTYVYDDFDVFGLDNRLRDPAQWGRFWTESYNGGVDNLYRPLVSMTYAVQWWLDGADAQIDESDAWKYHLVNVLLHAAVSALVAELARRLAGVRAAWVAGLLFAAHPIHVEPVANIVGRAELMCAAGVIGALVLFMKPLTPARALAITGCFLVALLSKEQGMLTPLLVLILSMCRQWRRAVLPPLPPGEVRGEGGDGSRGISAAARFEQAGPPHPNPLPEGGTKKGISTFFSKMYLSPFLGRFAPGSPPHPGPLPEGKATGTGSRAPALLLVILLTWTLAAYILFREWILKFWWDRSFLDWTINPLVRPDADRWLMPLVHLGRYVALLVAPYELSPDYGATVIGWTVRANDPYLYVGIAAIVAWLVWFILALRRRDGVATFCLLGLALTYGVVSNFPILIGVNFAERLMYLPSAFFVILVATLLTKLPRNVVVPLLAVVLILAVVRSFTYALRWNDRQRFYETSLREQPGSIRLYLLLVSEHLSRGRFDEASRLAEEASQKLPDYWEIWIARANVAMEQGDFAQAERHLITAMKTPRAPTARVARWMMLLEQKKSTVQPASSPSPSAG